MLSAAEVEAYQLFILKLEFLSSSESRGIRAEIDVMDACVEFSRPFGSLRGVSYSEIATPNRYSADLHKSRQKVNFTSFVFAGTLLVCLDIDFRRLVFK